MVPTGAGLVARCLDLDPAKRRADFDAWAEALGAARSPEHTSGGRRTCGPSAEHYPGCTVTVPATLTAEDEEGEQ